MCPVSGAGKSCDFCDPIFSYKCGNYDYEKNFVSYVKGGCCDTKELFDYTAAVLTEFAAGALQTVLYVFIAVVAVGVVGIGLCCCMGASICM